MMVARVCWRAWSRSQGPEATARFIQRMLEAKVVMPDGVVVSTEEGVARRPASPLLGNVVLDELDRELVL